VRLSAFTDEIDQSLSRALDVCEELGIDAVELRVVDGRPIVVYDQDELSALRAELDRRGFSVVAIASPYLKCNRGDDLEEQLVIHERAVTAATILGAPIVRAFSFWREPDPLAVMRELGPALRRAAESAQAAGVALAIENEHDCNVGSAAEAAAALEAAGAPALGVIWDAGNAAMLDPAGYSGLGGLETIYDRVVHVHLKDVDRDRNWVRIGDGVVDHSALFKFLSDSGYDGYLSFETHFDLDGGREAATRANVAAARELGA
jgi:sugar phosphate isomerase/epimerase